MADITIRLANAPAAWVSGISEPALHFAALFVQILGVDINDSSETDGLCFLSLPERFYRTSCAGSVVHRLHHHLNRRGFFIKACGAVDSMAAWFGSVLRFVSGPRMRKLPSISLKN
jgi:hypothetical protein